MNYLLLDAKENLTGYGLGIDNILSLFEPFDRMILLFQSSIKSFFLKSCCDPFNIVNSAYAKGAINNKLKNSQKMNRKEAR